MKWSYPDGGVKPSRRPGPRQSTSLCSYHRRLLARRPPALSSVVEAGHRLLRRPPRPRGCLEHQRRRSVVDLSCLRYLPASCSANRAAGQAPLPLEAVRVLSDRERRQSRPDRRTARRCRPHRLLFVSLHQGRPRLEARRGHRKPSTGPASRSETFYALPRVCRLKWMTSLGPPRVCLHEGCEDIEWVPWGHLGDQAAALLLELSAVPTSFHQAPGQPAARGSMGTGGDRSPAEPCP